MPIYYSTKKIVFVAFLLFITIFPAISQTDFRPGYYITWENDTIHGLLDYRTDIINSIFCTFKKCKDSEPIQFEPSALKEYRFTNSKYYISKKIEVEGRERQVFIELLVDGITSLYYIATPNYSSIYFIEDLNGNLIELTNELKDKYIDGIHIRKESLEYIGLLKVIFADCTEIHNEINKVRLNHKSLINITKKYHEYICDWEKCIVYQKPVSSLNVKIAPVVGINVIQLHFRETLLSNFDFAPNTVPSFGLILNSSLPRLNENLAIELGCNFYNFKPHGLYTLETDLSTLYYESNIDITSLQPSIALKYTFPWGKFNPVFAFGFASNIFLSKNQNTIISESNNNKITYTEKKDFIPLVSDFHGLLFELGSTYILENSLILFLNIKFNVLGNYKHNLALSESGIRTNILSSNISLGVFFNTKKE